MSLTREQILDTPEAPAGTAGPTALTRDQILSRLSTAFTITPIDVPELGGRLYVRCMSGAERARFEEGYAKDPRTSRARLVASCCCDEAGDRLFSDEDVARLDESSGVVLERLATAALRVNGLAVEAGVKP